jgi:hypothetical protein
LKFKKCCLEKLTIIYDRYQFEFAESGVCIDNYVPNAIVRGIDDLNSPESSENLLQRAIEEQIAARTLSPDGLRLGAPVLSKH